jgi:hypothetical protein
MKQASVSSTENFSLCPYSFQKLIYLVSEAGIISFWIRLIRQRRWTCAMLSDLDFYW